MELTGKKLINYIGNYDYYLEKREVLQPIVDGINDSDTDNQKISETKEDWLKQKSLDADRRKHQKEVEKTENEIALLEDKKNKLTDQMNNPDIASNSARLNELAKEIEDIDNSLSVLIEKWESLLD